MGGYITTSRSAVEPWIGHFRTSGTGTPSTIVWDGSPAQVTTSYRTRGRTLSADDVLFKGGTLGGNFKAIKEANPVGPSSYDRGHTFNTINYKRILLRPLEYVVAGGAYYKGPFTSDSRFHSSRGATYPEVGNAPDKEHYGTLAINRSIPTKSPANLAEALIEIKREGIPRLIGETVARKPGIPSIGSEYLNSEFGWKPIFRDLLETAHAILNAEKLFKQYERDSGRPIRRSRGFAPVINTIEYPAKAGQLRLPNSTAITNMFFNAGAGTLREVLETRIDYWFKGCFSYYLPPNQWGGGLERDVERAKWLLGLDINSSVLWEVLPWSWLSDWMANVGVIISNQEAFRSDGLVLRYGYLMCKTTSERTVTLENVRYKSGAHVGPVSTVFRTIRKERVRATPYGFGLYPTSFTTRQWAILGALGLSKSPNTLRYND